MRCRNCNVNIKSPSENCPLCGKYINRNEGEEYDLYPGFNASNPKPHRWVVKLLLFITIVLTILLFVANMLTPHKYIWCTVPISALWVAWVAVGIPIVKRRITPGMIIEDNILISILLIIIDTTFKQNRWAMSYVVPFVLSGSALVVTIIVLCMKMTWKRLYLFQMAVVATCFIPLVIRVFFKFVVWPSIVSGIYSLIVILGVLIFSDKRFKYETKKRLHF